MFGRVLDTLLIATAQCKYNIKFSKGIRPERCERKQKRNEFDERNARTWVRTSSFIHSKEQKQQPATL